MAKWFPHGVAGVALIGSAVIWAIPIGAADPVEKKKGTGLDDGDVKAIIDFNTKVIQEVLKEEKLDKPSALKAKTAAIMIASAAQSGGAPRSKELATLRDAALKLAATIAAKEYADARKQAQALPTLKPNPDAKMDAVKIMDKQIELDDVMNQFSGVRGGGLKISSKLEDWEDELPKEGMADVIDVANQLCLVFETVREHEANTKLGTQAQWEKFADTARARAGELRTATSKGSGATMAAVKAMNMACLDCHKTFNPKKP